MENKTESISMKSIFMRCFFVCILFTALSIPTQAQQRKPAVPAKEDKEEEKIFTKIELEAGFREGPAAWLRFLQKNLHYQPKTTDNETTGTVQVQFVIYATGKTGNVEVLNNTDTVLAREIKRVFALSDGLWRPAAQCGRLVNAYKTMPINICLRGN
jgi:protein TonB